MSVSCWYIYFIAIGEKIWPEKDMEHPSEMSKNLYM
jgi:hypothetical protein